MKSNVFANGETRFHRLIGMFRSSMVPLADDIIRWPARKGNEGRIGGWYHGCASSVVEPRGAILIAGNRRLIVNPAKATTATAWKIPSIPPCSAPDRLRTSAAGRRERSGP